MKPYHIDSVLLLQSLKRKRLSFIDRIKFYLACKMIDFKIRKEINL